jgi:replicative DNA helicase
MTCSNLENFQWKIINLLLDDAKNLYKINLLSEEYFNENTLPIFLEIKRLFLLGKDFDRAYIQELCNIKIQEVEASSSLFEEYINVLRDHDDREKIEELVKTIDVFDLKSSREKLIKVTNELLTKSSSSFVTKNRVREIVDELSIAPELTDVIRTGVDELDNIINGFLPGDLDIIGGRPSMGKSGFALQIMLINAYKNKRPTLYFSLEDTEENVIKRSLAHITGISYNKILHNRLDDADKNMIYGIVNEFNDSPFYILDNSKTIYDIVADVRKLKLIEKDLNLVVVDYIQLISSDDEDFQSVTRSSKTLKMLAKDLKISVLGVSQLSRLVEQRDDKRPISSDLRSSGNLEQEASRVLFLYRPHKYTRSDADKDICEYILDKNKHGETKIIKGHGFMECFQFS